MTISSILSFSDALSVLQKAQILKGIKLEILRYTSLDEEAPRDERTKQKIIVDGINDDIDTEMLEMYFENYKKSSGGEIEHLELISDTTAVITFEDAEGKLKARKNEKFKTKFTVT